MQKMLPHSSMSVRDAAEELETQGDGLNESHSAVDDPLVSHALCSLAAFGIGMSRLAAKWDSPDIPEKQQQPQAGAVQTVRAASHFEDFCLASSLANLSLSRLQLPLLHEVAPLTAPTIFDGAEDDLDLPKDFPSSDLVAFSAALRTLHSQLLHVVSTLPTGCGPESELLPTRIRR